MKDAEKVIPTVTVEFEGGEKHDVKCSFGVFVRFQMLTGLDPFNTEQMKKLSPKDHVALLAAAIYKKNPEEHLEEIAEKMSFSHLTTITSIIEKLFENAAVVEQKKSDSKDEPGKTEVDKSQTNQNQGG